MIKFCLIILSIAFSQALHSQNSRHTISGIVKDIKNGETLTGAIVFTKEVSSQGTASNPYGFFSLTLPDGEYHLIMQYVGYEAETLLINLKADTVVNINLKEKTRVLNTVVINAEQLDKNVKSTEIGIMKMDIKAIEAVPVIFGEKDVMKTLQLLPGVQAVGEGNSGFYVRGGSVDQNLILLDEATVYNASHLIGFFSVFNSDALKNVTLSKGGIPAEYGGRLASVVDVKMNDGNSNKYSVKGGVGIISSRVTIEGPIIKEKSSFIFSARRTYMDQFLKLSSNPNINKSKLYFYDLNLKASYTLGKNDRIFLSGYYGRDVLGLSTVFGVDWGNTTATIRWNHTYSGKLFSNTSLVFSDYSFFTSIQANATNQFTINSSIRDYNLKQDYTYYANNKNTVKFGFNGIHHRFIPASISANGSAASFLRNISISEQYAIESAAYISNDQAIGARFQLTYGLRYSLFNAIGPGVVFGYDSDGVVTDTTTYAKGQQIANYGGIEPRFSGRYTLNETSSLKASYMRTRQYLHFLSNSTSGTPVDLWIPSSKGVQPQIGDQVSLGYFKNFRQNLFETSVEIYYKNMQNQIDYRPYAQLLLNPTVESQLIYGRGFAYGSEFFIKKTAGKLNGWISYTLARSQRQFDAVNKGEIFSARQDRIHSASLVVMYEYRKWSFGTTLVYYTGNAVTFPSGKYQYEGVVLSSYTERNGYRMPAYHRMDLSATYYRKKTEKFESSWNFSIYNVYGRKNAYQIIFQADPADATRTQAVRIALFSIVPSITYNFKF